MNTILLVLSSLILVLLVVVLVKLSSKKGASLDEAALMKVKEELRTGNDESFNAFRLSYDRDMSRLLSETREAEKTAGDRLGEMTRTLNSLSSSVLSILREDAENQNVRNTALQKTMNENFDRVREDNRKSFELISEKSEKLKDEVKAGMDGIREGNEKKLSEIQGVVDTKLQETLDRRITQSFEAVTENLSKLYKAMGTLDVLTGDVKKMNSLFSNVKSRGVWGEMQAENILSDILTPDQWVKNYSPKKNREMVEFAIRLPGKDTGEIYLPIDSKFPVADYERYRNAVDAADSAAVEAEVKNLRKVIEKEAKTIRDLYIVPPETTDFALLFLPSEALYLEMLKIDGLVEKIQNEYRVVLTGPNNFSALLSSLSLGFKTMQIEAYTSNIWHLFEDLKKLFADLSKSVDESKKSVDKASESLERARVKKEKISSVLTRMESNADRASIGSREEYYLESEEENSES